MVESLLKDASKNMDQSIQALQKDLVTLRVGRATPALLDKILVEYYGVLTPIVQMASVSVPEARTLLIQPWDKGTVKEIERAILKSDLGMTPISDGTVIRLPIPVMTEERRLDLVKVVRKKGEDCKILIRNARRDVNDLLRDLEKSSEISEDDLRRSQDEVQKLTDAQVKKIEDIIDAKEKEIMEV